MDTDFCVAALDEALQRYGTPTIFNTDCQWEYKSVPVSGIEKCTTLVKKNYSSGVDEMVESPPFWMSCLAKACP